MVPIPMSRVDKASRRLSKMYSRVEDPGKQGETTNSQSGKLRKFHVRFAGVYSYHTQKFFGSCSIPTFCYLDNYSLTFHCFVYLVHLNCEFLELIDPRLDPFML